MTKRVEIPVRTTSSTDPEPAPSDFIPEVTEAGPSVTREGEGALDKPVLDPVTGRPVHVPSTPREEPEEESMEVWRDRALRLQAEMKNYRKRQQRLAEEHFAEEREELLRAFLRVADDLERALNANGVALESLRQGVELTHQTLMQILNQEGVKLIQAIGQPFNPAWHEAVGTVPHQKVEIEPGMVAVVVQEGYRLGDRLLRPARVIVTD
jgi:molecular chaperone GrpE